MQDNKMSEVKLFVYVSVITGFLMLMLVPPFNSPDENAHFKKAYVLVSGNLFADYLDSIYGYNIPDNLIQYSNDLTGYMGQLEKKFNFASLYFSDQLNTVSSEHSFVDFSTAKMNPVAHIIPAIGIALSKLSLFPKTINSMIYAGRLACLISYIVIVSLAIFLTPVFKKTFLMIGLWPMSIFLASTISYDTLVSSLSLLAIALVLKLCFDKEVKKNNWKYTFAFSLIGIVLLNVKTIYLLIYLFLLCIPTEKFGTKKNKWITFVLISIPGLLCFGINALKYLKPSASSNDLALQQLNFVLQDPIRYLKIFFTTIISSRQYLVSSGVACFGLLDTNVLTLFCFFIVVFFDFTVSRVILNKYFKIYSVLIIFLCVFLMYLAMYLFWTTKLAGLGVGASFISGVQGRYFIPLILPFCMLFSNNLFKTKKNEYFYFIVLENSSLISITMLIISIITIWLRFW